MSWILVLYTASAIAIAPTPFSDEAKCKAAANAAYSASDKVMKAICIPNGK